MSSSRLSNADKGNASAHPIRRRKRALRKEVLGRFQFLFGEPNLRHDKHLRSLLSSNPQGVALGDLLTFTSLKQFASDEHFVRNVIKDIPGITITDEGKLIFNPSGLPSKENANECTIFVDSIPANASIAWLKQVFSKHGQIDYIHLPKYKSTHTAKGYAVIEFATTEAAISAASNGSLEVPVSAPQALVLPRHPHELHAKKRRSTGGGGARSEFSPSDKRKKSRKMTLAASASDSSRPALPKSEPTITAQSSAAEAEPAESTESLTKLSGEGSAKVKSSLPKKRKRRRRRKIDHSPVVAKNESVRLTVLSYQRWQDMKREYKNLQRKNFAAVKQVCRQFVELPGGIGSTAVETNLPVLEGRRKKKLRGADSIANKAAALQDLFLKTA